MGSKNDWGVMKPAAQALKKMGVGFEVRVISAHRSPSLAEEYIKRIKSENFTALICGAGGAAHLAGVFAGQLTIPVIGVPVSSGALKGMDALLATVQMPQGIPVATVAIDGAFNAGLLASQIVAGNDSEVAAKLKAHKVEMLEKVIANSHSLAEEEI